MASTGGERAKHFPAIEKKHGLPMSHWFDVMGTLEGKKYQEQVDFLRENHGFSQAHANALVMHSRGSVSSRRHDSVEAYLATLDPVAARTVGRIMSVAVAAVPGGETVMAWNQPMVRTGKSYVLGASALARYILIGPWATDAIARLSGPLAGYTCNKKTVQVPLDWDVDVALITAMVDLRLAELDPK